MIHWHEFNLVGVFQRRVNPFSAYELTHVGHDFHTFITKEEIDKRLRCIRMCGLVVDGHVVAVAEHFAQPHVIHRRALFSVFERKFYKGDGDRVFSSDDTVSGYSRGVLARVKAAGIRIVGATGRGPRPGPM